MANEYWKSSEEVMQELGTTPTGLNREEVLVRLEKVGRNQLEEGKKTSLLVRFFKELCDPMVIVLLAAATVSAITAIYANESFTDVFIILMVVVVNAILGVYQESKAEKAIEALAKMSAATSKVMRNHIMQIVKSEELVPGDIILLEAGDAVPADARIIECASLKVEEAALSGESVPVSKKAEVLHAVDGKDIVLGDRKNMIYMGSSVAYGRASAVVCATGMNTEMGKIANALTQAKEEATPLQKKLNQLSKVLSVLVLGICIFIFVVDVMKSYPNINGDSLLSTFMVAVSLAVAAIPEGLAAVVTVVLSMGVTKMSKHNAIIRKLTAVETLGCTQIICSDKTGTLTQNKMTVVKHYGEDEMQLAKAMALCSDAQLGEDKQAVGEPTECALVNYANQLGLSKTELLKQAKRVGEAPFDSMRKMMSTVHEEDGTIIQYTKGAVDEVLKRCTHIYKNHQMVAMTKKDKEEIEAINKQMADDALRVLGAAMRFHEQMPSSWNSENLEKDLCFIGLCGMIDPIREEVKDAIVECQSAGITPIMITGDHKDTAIAIAKSLGILTSEKEALTGAELNDISQEELKSKITQYRVYARVQPEHKVRIVNAWRANGKVTAMTGDGVNDAPSIKNADIGVGMGITGTDVTKNVADMVLADDNFATIVHAVAEGRRIYDNIRKSIQFLLSSNLAEVVTIFTATMMSFTILRPVHLLWINLLTDTFPALALGMEEGEKDIMQRPPRDPKESIFAQGLGWDVVMQGIVVTVLTLAAYFIGHYMESGNWEVVTSADGMTMAFLTLSMVEIAHSFNLRSRRKSLFSLPKQNKYLWMAGFASLFLTTAVIYVPFLADAFGFEHISFMEYSVALLLAISIIPCMEIVKFIQRKFEK